MNAGAVRLEPLTADETRRLIAALLAIDDLPETVRTTIVERAQGNPLYVEELLRMLIDAGHVAEREGRWVATRGITDLAVPGTLQGLLALFLRYLNEFCVPSSTLVRQVRPTRHLCALFTCFRF